MRVELEIVGRRNSRGIVEQHRDVVGFGDRKLLCEFIAEIGCVNHRGLVVDGVRDFLGRFDEDQICTGQPDGTVERAAATGHDDLMSHTGRIRQLPNFCRVGARHARRRRCCHRSRRAGSDHPGFGASQFGQFAAGGILQFDHVDEMVRSFGLCGAHFRELQ